MLAIWSLAPLTFLKPAWTSGISQFTYCWSLTWRILNSYMVKLNVIWQLAFLKIEFKPTFSLSTFTFIKRLLSSSSLSSIRVVSYAYMSLLIFLPAILILSCFLIGSRINLDSSSPAFYMMYSVYKLNKQGDNIQPWLTPFPLWNQSVVPCPVLTVASWPAYRILKRQIRWSGIPISFRIFHSLLWSTQSKALA